MAGKRPSEPNGAEGLESEHLGSRVDAGLVDTERERKVAEVAAGRPRVSPTRRERAAPEHVLVASVLGEDHKHHEGASGQETLHEIL
jgi:hypothetical protein